MKKNTLITGIILCLTLILAGCATTGDYSKQQADENLTWWPTKAVPQPKQDAETPGQWWWPTKPGDETKRIWGNQGYVYVLRRESIAEPEAPVKLPVAVKPVEQMKIRDVHFHYKKSKLTPAAQELMLSAVKVMKEYPNIMITLEGHTCSCASRSYNHKLGQARADTVERFLANNGISRDRLTAVSYGETRPVAETEDVRKCVLLPESSPIRKAHALNRRVEFSLE